MHKITEILRDRDTVRVRRKEEERREKEDGRKERGGEGRRGKGNGKGAARAPRGENRETQGKRNSHTPVISLC